MRVKDRMRETLLTVEPDAGLAEAADLIAKHEIRHLPVVKSGRLVGILTDRDIREAWPSQATSLAIREIRYKLDKVPVSEVMSAPVVTVAPRTPLSEAARLMHERKIGALPVVEGETLVGILTESDLIDTLVDVLPG
jgi:acetoin utilization protein AcuB